jgi:hypothetical protein
VSVGQPGPVLGVDDPAALDRRAGVGGQPGTAPGVGVVDDHGVGVSGVAVDADLDPLAGAHRAGRQRVQRSVDGDHGVLADPAQMPVGDQIRPWRDRQQSRPVGFGADRDHLAMGAVDLGAADRQPPRPRGVELGDRVETPPGQNMVAGDRHLPFDPALAGGPVGGEHVEAKPVMLGERRGLGMDRDRPARGDVAADHGLGAVIDDRAGHSAEVGEGTAVAIPERGHVHRGGEAGERVTRVGQRHVERIHTGDPDMGQHRALIAPVDLPLGAGDHLESAVQSAQRVVLGGGQLRGDPRAGLSEEHLDTLIRAGEAMLGDQPLVDHRALQRDLGAQPGFDQLHERADLAGLGADPRRSRRGRRRRISGQVLLHRPPIDPALAGDLGIGGARCMQRAETTDIHPGLRINDHEQVTLRVRLLGGGRTEG